MPYLDVIHRLRSSSVLPIAAYHVSGEYAMMKAAAQKVGCLCGPVLCSAVHIHNEFVKCALRLT